MLTLLRDLSRDESGFILSAEIVIILTVAILGMVVGLVNLQNALLGEFADLSMAFQSLNQSYSTPSYRGCMKWWGGRTSWVAGSTFIDIYDGCVSNPNAGYYAADIQGGTGYYSSTETCPITTDQPATTTCPTGCTTGCPTDLLPPSPAPSTPATPVTPAPQGAAPTTPPATP
ncbi:hypothetical protein [Schlesneria paludicola]|uniref:hypothetical protein n=1 Tax=Schlesneria paludicola TaxID=360056 RepID=UPI00029A970F|nr:hypothetical protein [Schlesneria paludicola]